MPGSFFISTCPYFAFFCLIDQPVCDSVAYKTVEFNKGDIGVLAEGSSRQQYYSYYVAIMSDKIEKQAQIISRAKAHDQFLESVDAMKEVMSDAEKWLNKQHSDGKTRKLDQPICGWFSSST